MGIWDISRVAIPNGLRTAPSPPPSPRESSAGPSHHSSVAGGRGGRAKNAPPQIGMALGGNIYGKTNMNIWKCSNCGYPQIIHFNFRCSTTNHPYFGAPKPPYLSKEFFLIYKSAIFRTNPGCLEVIEQAEWQCL